MKKKFTLIVFAALLTIGIVANYSKTSNFKERTVVASNEISTPLIHTMVEDPTW